jgi:hypothetical protein
MQDRLAGGRCRPKHRLTRIKPIAKQFATWLAAVEPTLSPSAPLTSAVAYHRNHWAALTRFVDDAQVPIDNSPTEREFQNFCKVASWLEPEGLNHEGGEWVCGNPAQTVKTTAALVEHDIALIRDEPRGRST